LENFFLHLIHYCTWIIVVFQQISEGLITLDAVHYIDVFYTNFNPPDPATGQYFYHRKIDTEEDKAAIACLLNVYTVLEAYVFTWINITELDQVDKVSN